MAHRLVTAGRFDAHAAAVAERDAKIIPADQKAKLHAYLSTIATKARKLMHPYSTNVLESMNSLKAGATGKHFRRIGTYSARSDIAVLRFNESVDPSDTEHVLLKLIKHCGVTAEDIPASCHQLCERRTAESKRNRKDRKDDEGQRSRVSRMERRATNDQKSVQEVKDQGGQASEDLRIVTNAGPHRGGKGAIAASIRKETDWEELRVGHEDVTPATWFNRISVTAAQAAELAAHKQGSTEWLRSRMWRITASNFHAATGKTVTSCLKRHLWPSGVITPAMQWGLDNEPVAREAYKSRVKDDPNVSSIEIEERGLVVPLKYPWLGASPDGIVTINYASGEKQKVLLEIKCPQKHPTRENISPNYRDQVNGTMGIYTTNSK